MKHETLLKTTERGSLSYCGRNINRIYVEGRLSFFFIYLAALGLSCSMWDLVPRPGMKPGPPALGARSLSHWTAREAHFIMCSLLLVISLPQLNNARDPAEGSW